MSTPGISRYGADESEILKDEGTHHLPWSAARCHRRRPCSLTTTVLDVSLGKPAEGVHVNLQVYRDSGDFGVFDPVSQQFSPCSFSESDR